MKPPHEKHCNAKRFRELVDAKVPSKRNDLNPKEHKRYSLLPCICNHSDSAMCILSRGSYPYELRQQDENWYRNTNSVSSAENTYLLYDERHWTWLTIHNEPACCSNVAAGAFRQSGPTHRSANFDAVEEYKKDLTDAKYGGVALLQVVAYMTAKRKKKHTGNWRKLSIKWPRRRWTVENWQNYCHIPTH